MPLPGAKSGFLFWTFLLVPRCRCGEPQVPGGGGCADQRRCECDVHNDRGSGIEQGVIGRGDECADDEE
jgi:hypothetical protein